MTVRAPHCGFPVHLTAADVARFDADPFAAFVVDPELPCQLERGHSGPHATIVQSAETPGRFWWALWWSGRGYRIGLLPDCTVTLDSVRDKEGEPAFCTAYACHGGGHMWAL